jgi:hypothetical protein
MLRRASLVMLMTAALLAFPGTAHADIAPPAQPPGANPGPADASTQVRMQAETVLIAVQPTAPSGSLGRASVTADFTMRNLGTQPETMAARFPIGASDGRSAIPQIKDLRILVDGRTAHTRLISGEDPYGMAAQVPWIEFDVTFPVAVDVHVRVTYLLEAAGDSPFVWFKYILSTGAGWRDTIGSADLIVRLPYAASNENVLFNFPASGIDTTPGGVIAGNEVRWHYDNLEPTKDDSFEVDLVTPPAWEQVLKEQSNVSKNPKDGEAWGRLGKLYKELTFSPRGKGFRLYGEMDPGGQDLYQRALQAYEKAVSLKPGDTLWHAGFADLLAYHAHMAGMLGQMQGVDTRAEAVRALGEIKQALLLARNDPQVIEIAQEISSEFPDGMIARAGTYDYPWLTATPLAPTPWLGADVTPGAVESPTPVAASTISTPPATGASQSSPSLPVCGSAMVLAVATVYMSRRRS